MNTNTKTRTTPLRPSAYITFPDDPSLRTVNMTALVDDAVEALAGIRYNGYGAGNQRRSRCVVSRSFQDVLIKAGYTERQAGEQWRNQVLAIDDLNTRADY